MASFRLMFNGACDLDADTAAQARASQDAISPHLTAVPTGSEMRTIAGYLYDRN